MKRTLTPPGTTLNNQGIELLSVRNNRPRKYGDYYIMRDVIVTDMENVYINGGVYPFNKSTFDELLEKHKKRTHTADVNKLRIWVWELHANVDKLRKVIAEPVCHKTHRTERNGIQYMELDHILLCNFKYIISSKMDIVKVRKLSEVAEDVPDVTALAIYADNYTKKRRYLNPCTETYAASVVTDMYRHMSDELRDELSHEVRNMQRCPHADTVHELIMGHKAGILYYKPGIEEQLLKNVYSYDSSSYYTSQLFNDDFPIGKLERVECSMQMIKLAVTKGWWFAVHGVSKEDITLECNALKPFTESPKKDYIDEDGYYHYTIVPYDYALYRDCFGFNIFEDQRFTWTGLSICKQTGRLNQHFLDFIMQMYNLKDTAATPEIRQYCKDGLNMMIGKSYVRSLLNRDKHIKWYCQPEHYLCPQFGLHLISKARYDTMMLACELGKDNIVALVTDCIKSQDPRIHEIIAEHNKAISDKMAMYGYPDTTLGQWTPEHHKHMVYFRADTYVVDNEDKVKPVLSGCREPQRCIHEFKDIFESDVIPEGSVINAGGTRYLSDWTLWKNTDNRLKAKEEFYGMEKSDTGV